jgi:hypothetical protein
VILLHVSLEDSLIVEDEAALLAAVALLLRILRINVASFRVKRNLNCNGFDPPASFDTLEFERRAEAVVLNKVLKISKIPFFC